MMAQQEALCGLAEPKDDSSSLAWGRVLAGLEVAQEAPWAHLTEGWALPMESCPEEEPAKESDQ